MGTFLISCAASAAQITREIVAALSIQNLLAAAGCRYLFRKVQFSGQAESRLKCLAILDKKDPVE
jgi:hypothetical protein